MRNAKVLGLALVAMLAICAVAATAASADDALTAESYPVTLTGGPDGSTGLINSTAGTLNCSGVQYHGSLAGASSTLSVTPTFSGCVFFGFPGSIHMNGCSYLFHLVAGTTQGTVDIVCPEGKEITGTSISGGTPKCTIHVKAQTGLGSITFNNVGAGATRELTIAVNLQKIHYTHTEGSGLGKCTSGTGSTATLTSKITATAESTGGGGHVGIFLSTI